MKPEICLRLFVFTHVKRKPVSILFCARTHPGASQKPRGVHKSNSCVERQENVIKIFSEVENKNMGRKMRTKGKIASVTPTKP